jgi:5-formyltetrahydrofolate cyclo-ligase
MEKDKGKKEIRSEINRKLSLLSDEEVREKSRLVMKNLYALSEFLKAVRVFTYVSTGREPDTQQMIRDIMAEKDVYVPRCLEGDTLEAVRIRNFEDLVKGRYGILEPGPRCADIFPGGEGSLVIVPGVALDVRGNRLGRGKGCYDRCLAGGWPDCPVWALGYDLQVMDRVPLEPWDRTVSGIVTETKVIRCR